MTRELMSEIVNGLRRKRWRFYYGPDVYAYQLLTYLVDLGVSFPEIRRSSFARLLDRPVIKARLAQFGQRQITPAQWRSWRPAEPLCYLLTLDGWGEAASRYAQDDQTSRPGYNLVLQLNFSNQHNRPYEKLIEPTHFHPYEYDSHPIAAKPRLTMSWVRIDLANDLSHALIEEVQNDWLRRASNGKTCRWRYVCEGGRWQWIREHCNGGTVSAERRERYYEETLRPHRALWAEASLCAAIKLLYEEIGVRRIYYHTFTGGNLMKGIDAQRRPPRSLYGQLPRQFCFNKTQNCPAILEKYVAALHRDRRNDLSQLAFYELILGMKGPARPL